jgi:hypothetical protein
VLAVGVFDPKVNKLRSSMMQQVKAFQELQQQQQSQQQKQPPKGASGPAVGSEPAAGPAETVRGHLLQLLHSCGVLKMGRLAQAACSAGVSTLLQAQPQLHVSVLLQPVSAVHAYLKQN